MLHLLAQPQKELQLNLKTNITQNRQKIDLYGSVTTKDLKKPRSFRWTGGVDTQKAGREAHRCSVVQRGGSSGGIAHSRVADKNQEGDLGSK